MPKVHFIKRKWLKKHKLIACLHQAERLERMLKTGIDESNGDDIPSSLRVDSLPRDIDQSLAVSPDFSGCSPRVLTRMVSTESMPCCPTNAISPSQAKRDKLKREEEDREMRRQQRAIKRHLQSLAVLVPEGTLGVSLASDNDGTVVEEVRKTSVLTTLICPGDKIISIEGEDVSQLDETEISTMLALWHSRSARKLVIKPSLSSCKPFTNTSKKCSQLDSNNFKTRLIYEGVKAYIMKNRMSFNEVRVLLQQQVSFLSDRVGVKLDEIQEEELRLIWSEAKEYIGCWFRSLLNNACQPKYDAPAACMVKPPRNKPSRWGQLSHDVPVADDDVMLYAL
mmetsp:Transcript_27911/g.45402  ORF Transcript_27911/g.45402 Transcript_27911/m.45402 type:complete len:338 (-) Transcript_27911:112-1125(-)